MLTLRELTMPLMEWDSILWRSDYVSEGIESFRLSILLIILLRLSFKMKARGSKVPAEPQLSELDRYKQALAKMETQWKAALDEVENLKNNSEVTILEQRLQAVR